MVRMEQEMTKDSAVRCPSCGSCTVEMVKTAEAEVDPGVVNRQEEYRCSECGSKFLKPI